MKTNKSRKNKENIKNTKIVNTNQKKLKKESKYKEKYLRLLSEFDNFQKSSIKTIDAEVLRSKKRLLNNIIDFINDFALFKDNTDFSEAQKQILEGLEQKINHILTIEGITEIDVKEGDEYDSNKAEVIQAIDSPNNKNKIISIIQKGYILNDNVLRLAKVIVGN